MIYKALVLMCFVMYGLAYTLPRGSVDGYLTPQQVVDIMNSMRDTLPQYVGPVETIGHSYQQQPILAQKIGVNECRGAKSGLLLTGLHHAREPLTLSVLMNFVAKVVTELEEGSYEAIVRARQSCLHVIPIVNPDAYEANLETANAEERLLRKNMRPVCGHSRVDDGVDLNRNYDFYWSLDNEGSSPQGCSDMYRGTSPFSEPESRAVSDYVTQNKGSITVALNYHTFGRFVNIPYAVQSLGAPPDPIYKKFLSLAQSMTEGTQFNYGHPWAADLYTCNGEASDWMLQSADILAMSPELGPDYPAPLVVGFWPSQDVMEGLIQEGVRITTPAWERAAARLQLEFNQPQFQACGSHCTSVNMGVTLTNSGMKAAEGTLFVAIVPSNAVFSDAQFCRGPNAEGVACAVTASELGFSAPNNQSVTACAAPLRLARSTLSSAVVGAQREELFMSQVALARSLSAIKVTATGRKLDVSGVGAAAPTSSRVLTNASAVSSVSTLADVEIGLLSIADGLDGLSAITSTIQIELHANEQSPASVCPTADATSFYTIATDSVGCVVYAHSCAGAVVELKRTTADCFPCSLISHASAASPPDKPHDTATVPWPWATPSEFPIAWQFAVFVVVPTLLIGVVAFAVFVYQRRRAAAVSFTPVATEEPPQAPGHSHAATTESNADEDDATAIVVNNSSTVVDTDQIDIKPNAADTQLPK